MTTEHNTKTPHTATGIFAALRGLLSAKGTGAPKRGSRGLVFSVLSTALGVFAFTAAPALAAAPETPETGKASAVTATTATLEGGVLNPHAAGEVGEYEYRFRVSPTECEGESGTSPEPAAGAEKEAVPAVHLTNLQPNVEYSFCLVERNLAQEPSSLSPVEHFTTKPAPPAIESETASNVKSTEARLEGVVNPNNQLTECHVQYGKASAAENTVPCEPEVLKGYGGQGVGANVGGLEADHAYKFRIVAKNGAGEEEVGTEEEFKRVAEPPEKPETTAVEGITNTTAELHGVLNPAGSSNVSWHFEYAPGASCTGPGVAMTAVEGPEEVGAHDGVAVTVTGLAKGTEYAVCLVAENEAGAKAVGDDVSFSSGHVLPEVTGESFSEVGPSSVKLTGQINTQNEPGSYYFQYGTPTEFESDPHATPVVDLPAGSSPQPVSAQLEALQPATEYQFRIIATNAHDETTTGPTMSLKTFPTANPQLPDGRVYEKVTPTGNQDADVYVPFALPVGTPTSEGIETYFPFQVAGDGSAVTYVGDASTGGEGSIGKGLGDQYLARRVPDGGWVQSMIQPDGHRKTHFQGFSGDLGIGVLISGAYGEPQVPPLTVAAPAGGYAVLYTRDDLAQGSLEEELFQPLFSKQVMFNRSAKEFGLSRYVLDEGTQGEVPVFAGGSSDLGKLFFEANDDLTSVGDPLRPGLDERIESEVKNDRRPGGPGEGNDFLYESVDGQSNIVDVLPGGEVAQNATFGGVPAGNPEADPPDFDGAVSPDGNWVYWTDESSNRIYVRVNSERTVQVSGAGPAQYWTSAEGGRYAFYTEAGGLYRFDALSGAREALAEPGAGVQGVVGVSDDGSYLYFAADGALAAGASAQICEKEQDGTPCNLYVWHDGVTRLIAVLSGLDGSKVQPLISTSQGVAGGLFGDWQPGLGQRTAGVSANGGTVVFMSDQPLPVAGFPHGYPSGGADEVYLYQAASNQLFCASCSSSGEADGGAFLPVSWSDVHLPEWLADEGNRVFFDSAAPLVADDTNGQQDVYEWEREGTGGCTSETAVNGGCQYLLSGGTSETDSWFIGASESGDNAFIATRAQLTPEDRNDAFDLYDARVGGVQPVTKPSCTGTGCQGVPASPPTFATPPSVTADGPGNSPPAPPVAPVNQAKPLTRAQKLNRALKACKKIRAKRARSSCEARARRTYKTVKLEKTKARKAGRNGRASR